MTAEAFVEADPGRRAAGRRPSSSATTSISARAAAARPRRSPPTAATSASAVSVVPAVVDENGAPMSSSVDPRGACRRRRRHGATTFSATAGSSSARSSRGDRRGRELGFPTANIRLSADCRLRHGIYAVRFAAPTAAALGGVASYGRRPTFDNGAPLLEVFVFDFSGDLYGETPMVTFLDWVRPEERFPRSTPWLPPCGATPRSPAALSPAPGRGTALDRAVLALA